MNRAARRSGRPRDPEVDDRILDAARALLAEAGYEGLTFEAVATRAQVSRPTIYRRWESKAFLAYDAAFPTSDLAPMAYTGDLRADLVRLVDSAAAAYARPETRAVLPALLPRLVPGSELAAQTRDPLTVAARTQFRVLLDDAVQSGDARPSVDTDMLFDMLIGLVVFRVVVHGDWQPSASSQAVDLVCSGICL